MFTLASSRSRGGTHTALKLACGPWRTYMNTTQTTISPDRRLDRGATHSMVHVCVHMFRVERKVSLGRLYDLANCWNGETLFLLFCRRRSVPN